MAKQEETNTATTLDDDALLFEMIPGAVAEVDPRQIAILRKLTPAQRFQQMLSMIEQAETIAVERLLKTRPELSKSEALFIVRSEGVEE